MKFFRTLALSLALTTLATGPALGQCVTWTDSPQKEEAENAHVAYRNIVKGQTAETLAQMSDEEFQSAFNNWEKAYNIAPAADGQRPFHYRDGRMFHKAMAQKTDDQAKKQEHYQRVIELYDEELECYPEYEAFLLGRKGSDMFYLTGYSEDAISVIEQALESGGNETEYIVLAPLGKLLNYYYGEQTIDNVRVRELYDKAVGVADYNIENNEAYGTYYQAGKDNLESDIAQYADDIFDCAYFKEILLPKADENRDSLDVLRYIVSKLKAQGCDSTDADVVRVQNMYDELYASRAEEFETERRRLNPAYDASKLADEGNYEGAVEAYQRAIEKADDDEKKSQYYYRMAQIQMGELGEYGAARRSANEAISLDPNNGRPYLVIGDIYARLSRNCGDAWDQRLAVLAAIDKYQQARNVDSDVASDANRRIGSYASSLPLRSEGFQRGLEEGARLQVGCGIGETVTLRFQ